MKHYHNFLKTQREREKERESIRTAAAEDSNQKEGVYTCCCLAPFYLGNVCWPDNKGFFLEISGRHYRCRLQRNTLNYTTLHWSTHQLPPWLPGTGPDCGRWGGGGHISCIYQYDPSHTSRMSHIICTSISLRQKGIAGLKGWRDYVDTSWVNEQISGVKFKPAALLEPTQKQAGDQDVG